MIVSGSATGDSLNLASVDFESVTQTLLRESLSTVRWPFLPGEISPQAITSHLPGTLAGAFAALRAIVFHYSLAPDVAVFLDLQALIRVRRLAKESLVYDRQLKVEIAAEAAEELAALVEKRARKRARRTEWAERKRRQRACHG